MCESLGRCQVDVDGNVWTGVGDGVYVYSNCGELLGAVTIGEVSNLVFAGDTLIMLQARSLACAVFGVAKGARLRQQISL